MTHVSRVLIAAGLAVGLVGGLTSSAHAQASKKVEKTFKGKILITESALDLQSSDDDARVIADCKKQTLSTIKSYEGGDGVTTWAFHFTAFFKKKPSATEISVDFYTDDKEKLYVANKKLTGIDPDLTVLQSRLVISEDDGLNPKRAYVVKISTSVKGKEVILAQTKVATK
jgi:hypothetical protein